MRFSISGRNLVEFVGEPPFRLEKRLGGVGVITGLAWTSMGGATLPIEATVVHGRERALKLTGQLGKVMNESAQIAHSFVTTNSERYGLSEDWFMTHALHLHVPEGATPKDGPSAGVGMCTAIVSALTQVPVRANVAMTGEITLRGEVLPIGGLKEKLLAAQRGGIDTVLIPVENAKDLAEISDEIKDGLDIRPVQWIDDVLEVALARTPTAGGDGGEGLPEPVAGAEERKGDTGEVRHH